MAEWPQEFEDVLLRQLNLAPGATIDQDVPFTAAGLDSMAMVGLMLSLEEEFEIELPESELTIEAFYSPATLWGTVARYLPPGGSAAESGPPVPAAPPPASSTRSSSG